jgi:hypothetical protein
MPGTPHRDMSPTPPAGAGHQSRTGRRGGMPEPQSHQPGSLLRMLSERLAACGMEIREHWCGGELTEIAVTNPRDLSMGRVVMGGDGYFTWERLCKFRSDDDVRGVAQATGVLLDENMSKAIQERATESP